MNIFKLYSSVPKPTNIKLYVGLGREPTTIWAVRFDFDLHRFNFPSRSPAASPTIFCQCFALARCSLARAMPPLLLATHSPSPDPVLPLPLGHGVPAGWPAAVNEGIFFFFSLLYLDYLGLYLIYLDLVLVLYLVYLG
jgi:hypothetical protein